MVDSDLDVDSNTDTVADLGTNPVWLVSDPIKGLVLYYCMVWVT